MSETPLLNRLRLMADMLDKDTLTALGIENDERWPGDVLAFETCDEAARAIETLTRERDAAIHDRIAANNHWRLDYNTLSQERDVLREGLQVFADRASYGGDADSVPVDASALARGFLERARLSRDSDKGDSAQ